jgi:hypothetical protein
MTPKEKAKELYYKYEFVYIQNYTSKHEVKECCLLACDEIIEELKEFDNMDGYSQSRVDYFEDVKNEIKRL